MFGIDLLSFYSTDYYLDLDTLAKARNISPSQLYLSLGQKKIAIAPPDEDVVTLAANAAERVLAKLTSQEIASIDMLLFATESGIDFSKSAGIYVHKLLNLSNCCRVVELKQACYSATFGLQIALAMLCQNQRKKVLLLASDIARYSLNSAAETSQGCGAVAILLSAEPRLLAVEPESGFFSEEAMDFWRPNYRQEAFVDGKYSCEMYLYLLDKCWCEYRRKSGRNLEDHAYFCYHIPVPKLAEMAHRRLLKTSGFSAKDKLNFQNRVKDSLVYSREIGNCYTASLYVALASLLDNCPHDLSQRRLGLYSYGSGSSGEFFSALVQNLYREHLFTNSHREMLAKRQAIDYDKYCEFYAFKLPEDGSFFSIPHYTSGKFRLSGIKHHKRIYERIVF